MSSRQMIVIRIGQGRPKTVERRVWMLFVFRKAEFTKRPNVIHKKRGKSENDNSKTTEIS